MQVYGTAMVTQKLKNKAKQKVVNFFSPLFRSLHPNLLKFMEHLLIKLSEKYHVLKNNPNFNCKFEFFMEHLMNTQGVPVGPGAVVVKQ